MYLVTTTQELVEALENSYKEYTTIKIVNDISFNEGKKTIEIKEECQGIYLFGPATIRGVKFSFDEVESGIIFENIRIRVGGQGLKEDEAQDAFYANKCDCIKLINCSFTDTSDEVLSFDKCRKVKIHQCIIGDPLHIPTVNNEGEEYIHKEGKKGSHGFGIRCGSIEKLTISECLFIHCNNRNPQINNENMEKKEYKAFIKDNIIYNYGNHCLAYNSQPKHEDKGKFTVNYKHNTFVPGPRTEKKAHELHIQEPDKMKFKVKFIETNKRLYYKNFDVYYKGKTKKVDNGYGNRIPIQQFLENVGCSEFDRQDSKLKNDLVLALEKSEHVYDGYDDKPELWPVSGWKHW